MKTRTIKSPKYGIFEIQLDDDIYEELKNKKIFLKKIKTGKFTNDVAFIWQMCYTKVICRNTLNG